LEELAVTKLPSAEEALEEIRTKPAVPAWPTVGVALDLSKGATYQAVRRGDFEVVRFGRLIRVVTAPLRRQLGMVS